MGVGNFWKGKVYKFERKKNDITGNRTRVVYRFFKIFLEFDHLANNLSYILRLAPVYIPQKNVNFQKKFGKMPKNPLFLKYFFQIFQKFSFFQKNIQNLSKISKIYQKFPKFSFFQNNFQNFHFFQNNFQKFFEKPKNF